MRLLKTNTTNTPADTTGVSPPSITQPRPRAGVFHYPPEIPCLEISPLTGHSPGMDFAADIALFYADFGTPAQHTPAGGTASALQLVLFSLPGATALGGDLVMTAPTVQYPTAIFPNVSRGDLFTLSAQTWKVSEAPQPTEDGLEMLAPLTRIA